MNPQRPWNEESTVTQAMNNYSGDNKIQDNVSTDTTIVLLTKDQYEEKRKYYDIQGSNETARRTADGKYPNYGKTTTKPPKVIKYEYIIPFVDGERCIEMEYLPDKATKSRKAYIFKPEIINEILTIDRQGKNVDEKTAQFKEFYEVWNLDTKEYMLLKIKDVQHIAMVVGEPCLQLKIKAKYGSYYSVLDKRNA